MFQHLSALWLSRTNHLCQGFQGHISADLKYGKYYLIRLMVLSVIAMFVLALGYFISTLVLFGIISTLIVEF
jgi:uncharacterized membrane protein